MENFRHIKAEELRIGDLVQCFGQPYNITSIGTGNVKMKLFNTNASTDNVSVKDIVGIPLTEEWLLKLGFEKHHADFGNPIFMLKNTKASQNEWIVKLYPKELGSAYECKTQRFYYVHQLQNLYFALTGEELKINE